MKNSYLISAALLSLGLIATPSAADAQNYVPPVNYGGPNVVVNMDVLSPAPIAAPTPLTRAPSGLRSRSEAAANVPLRLRRPAPRAISPAAPALAAPNPYMQQQQPLVLKQPAPRQQITSAPLAPLSPVEPTRTELTPAFAKEIATPKQPEFSAKELVKAAEVTPAPVQLETPREIKDITPTIATKTQEKADDVKKRQRDLLAKVREDVLYDETKATAKETVAETKAVVDTTIAETQKTVDTMQDIAPSAPKMVEKTPIAAPVAPTRKMIKEPILPTTLAAPRSLITPPTAPVVSAPEPEAPVQLAALSAPTVTPPPVPAPVIEEKAPEVVLPVVETPKTQPAAVAAPAPEARPIGDKDGFRLTFADQSADLSSDDIAALNAVADRLTQTENAKIQLRAFADGTPETSSKARRLSLTRALTVRSYLLDKGVSATSMDVRALGTGAPSDAPADRVDIVFIR